MKENHGGFMKTIQAVIVVSWLVSSASAAHGPTYRSVSVDEAGRLSVLPSSGNRIQVPLQHDQVSFSQPSLSDDHTKIAWLANYANPSTPGNSADPIAGRLVVYGAGRVLRSFGTQQVFWSWQFAHAGSDVAFCTGPAHGGAETCELRRIDSGHLRAKWNVRAAGEPPLWVEGLSY